jgi:hypothetical protein
MAPAATSVAPPDAAKRPWTAILRRFGCLGVATGELQLPQPDALATDLRYPPLGVARTRKQGRAQMRGICRLLAAIVVVGGAWQTLGGPGPATAQVATKQMALTEKQVEGFIAVQGKMSAAKTEDELQAIAKEYGFASLEEHDDVEANILLLLEGINPQSRAFLEPPVQIKRRIEETMADRSLPEDARKRALQELTETLKSAQPIQFPANVALVQKYYDKLQAALQ